MYYCTSLRWNSIRCFCWFVFSLYQVTRNYHKWHYFMCAFISWAGCVLCESEGSHMDLIVFLSFYPLWVSTLNMLIYKYVYIYDLNNKSLEIDCTREAFQRYWLSIRIFVSRVVGVSLQPLECVTCCSPCVSRVAFRPSACFGLVRLAIETSWLRGKKGQYH